MNRTKVDVDIPIDKDFSKTENYSEWLLKKL